LFCFLVAHFLEGNFFVVHLGFAWEG
jgi:hypothetical protein